MTKQNIPNPSKMAVDQLAGSERGRSTCRLLRELFDTDTINGLDAGNRNAVLLLVYEYLSEHKTGEVMDLLNAVITPGERAHDEEERIADMIVQSGDYCARCGGPIDHKEPHTVCDSCRED